MASQGQGNQNSNASTALKAHAVRMQDHLNQNAAAGGHNTGSHPATGSPMPDCPKGGY